MRVTMHRPVCVDQWILGLRFYINRGWEPDDSDPGQATEFGIGFHLLVLHITLVFQSPTTYRP